MTTQFTLPIGHSDLGARARHAQWDLLMAQMSLPVIPPVLLYLLVQSRLTGGSAAVGPKG